MKAIEFNGDGNECDGDSTMIKGVYHLQGCHTDHTLCGETLDGDSLTAGSFNAVTVKAINCPVCIDIIKHCRGVRIEDLNQ